MLRFSHAGKINTGMSGHGDQPAGGTLPTWPGRKVIVTEGYLNNQFRHYKQVVIVVHSLGGLIARQTLAQTGLDSQGERFATLITLGSPFNGSKLASLAHRIPGVTSSGAPLSGPLAGLRLPHRAMEGCAAAGTT